MLKPISEPDWKVWRRISQEALQRYCQRILDGTAKFALGAGAPHDRYLKMFKYTRNADKKIGIAFNNLRRSSALEQLAFAVAEGIVTHEELAQFTEETQQIVRIWLGES